MVQGSVLNDGIALELQRRHAGDPFQPLMNLASLACRLGHIKHNPVTQACIDCLERIGNFGKLAVVRDQRA